MGNTQERPPGQGDGLGTKAEQTIPGNRTRSRAGSTEKPRAQRPPEKMATVANGNQKTAGQVGEKKSQDNKSRVAEDTSYLDAPAGALPPHLARLKNEGNHLFKNGQFGDAVEKYTQAISGCSDAEVDSPEDLSILHSNRAACHLKDGNSVDCISDCTRALELHPFSLKALLRRAMAYESLERYRKAYVDYKTVLQIDTGTQAAHDSVHRITKMLIEQDGPNWRDQLPEIPLVPLSAQQHRQEKPHSAKLNEARAAQKEAKKQEACFTSFKQAGNDLVRKGHFQEALEKYNECLQIKPGECSILTNRAICYLRLDRCEEARQDCDAALQLEPTNKKAFYRRALAHKGLQDYLAATNDLQEVLQLDPHVREAEEELEVVTGLFRQSLMDGATDKPRN
ncbi:sperm-associated antigen 1A isoform X2 [Hypomesus transpacificus]|uniref:sperm-associated antigen 1A isoform X2 n=1 Tax=Hypomesus transpacificus TaxID=137520 RepID=UPI001F07E974|nr:sperm-associated antigen 1A isoform X2 [Hypomesus transpacificus]